MSQFIKGYTYNPVNEQEEARRKAAGQMTTRQFRLLSDLAEARFGEINLTSLNKWSASRLISDLQALRADAPLPPVFVKAWVETGVLGGEQERITATPAPLTGPRFLGDLSWIGRKEPTIEKYPELGKVFPKFPVTGI